MLPSQIAYRHIFMKKAITTALIAIAALVLAACGSKHDTTSNNSHITADGSAFLKNGKPYRFIGTNMWYATILGSTGQSGDRQRLCRELDNLKALGITNLRILAGPDAGSLFANPAKPYLQEAPGKLNDAILAGLDYTLAELEKRDMEAVIYLNNAWDWSGGYGFYLKECGYGDSPNTLEEGGYDRYVDYCANFSRSTKAQELYYSFVEQIVSRTNSITGRPYKDEPAIMAWQLCNEPRPFARDNKEAFAAWIAKAAAIIKSIDPNHMVSVGSEGEVGCERDFELYERIHADKNIDYLTIHIWPVNWGWANRTNPDADIEQACSRSERYIAEHATIARRLGKPLVIEEFGFARRGNVAGIDVPTQSRDKFYNHIFASMNSNGVAGCNFWGWSGSGRPHNLVWSEGDDYLCDPPHEPQGWYSVFDSDSTTIEVIKRHSIKE